jgi:hypothetical protein
VFTTGTHWVAIRDSTGMRAGPFEATAGASTDQLVVGSGTLPDIYTGGDQERTWIQFGPGETYSRLCKVIQVTPQSDSEAELLAFVDDDAMYAALPPE